MTNTLDGTKPTETTALVADAVRHISPQLADYALAPIAEGFDWQHCLNSVPDGTWYLVVFRSLRKETADLEMLTEFDDRAFEEASLRPGLLHYFRGQLNERRECLSFCLWETQEQARVASALPLHQAAVGVVNEMYHSYRLERYWVSKQGMGQAPVFERLYNDPIPEHIRAGLPTARA
jgi:hypothetical protein